MSRALSSRRRVVVHRALGALTIALALLPEIAVSQSLPVVIEMGGGGDARWESIQLELGALHVARGMPLSIAVVPCRQSGSSSCADDGSLHPTYRLWTHEHPTVIEVGQHGRDNTEELGTLGLEAQRDVVEDGLAALLRWQLANGQPLFFTPARSSSNADTMTVLEDLEFQTFAGVTGGCPRASTTVDGFCGTVPLCRRSATGGRVYGPSCVLRSFDDLAAEIDSRAGEGAVAIAFFPQDFATSTSDASIDPAKKTAYETLLDAFAAAEGQGRYDLRTYDTHHRLIRGEPLPVPQSTPTPLPTPTVPPPSNLPVVFTEDDPEDGTWESATVRAFELFMEEGVPLVQQTVPCGAPSPVDGSECLNTTFHERYAGWMQAFPQLFEITQHGITHDESLGDLSLAEQRVLIERGLDEMLAWGLPQRPYAFAPPRSSINADTVTVLEELGFRTYERNAAACPASTVMDAWCVSIPMCEIVDGQRQSGPQCVFRAPEDLIGAVNSRAGEGKVWLNFHVQDLYLPDLVTLDETKVDALRAILQAFRDEEIAGHYDLMTMDSHWRMVRGIPTVTPGTGATPTPPPTATPTATPTPPPSSQTDAIYRESLAAPWVDASWNASVDYASTARASEGSRSIRVAQVGWGALSVRHGAFGTSQPLAPSAYSSVAFMVWSETSGFRLSVRLENSAGQAFPEIVFGNVPVGGWTRVTVPMSALNPNALPFDRLDVRNFNGTNVTYSVDDLVLVRSGAPAPTPTSVPPTATPTPTPSSSGKTIYRESLESPWVNASWSATVDFTNAERAFSGSRSIRVDEVGWGALSVHSGTFAATQSLDPADYASVDLRVWTGTPGFRLSVRLENDAQAFFPEIVFGDVPVGQWVAVSVPIDVLDPDGIAFDRVDVRNYDGTDVVYWVDELRLTGR